MNTQNETLVYLDTPIKQANAQMNHLDGWCLLAGLVLGMMIYFQEGRISHGLVVFLGVCVCGYRSELKSALFAKYELEEKLLKMSNSKPSI